MLLSDYFGSFCKGGSATFLLLCFICEGRLIGYSFGLAFCSDYISFFGLILYNLAMFVCVLTFSFFSRGLFL